MEKFLARLLLLSLSVMSASVFAVPEPFQASYSIKKSGMTLGSMNSRFQVDNATYTYTKDTKASGLAALLSGDQLLEKSEGKITNNRMMTQNYLHHHKSKKRIKRKFIN